MRLSAPIVVATSVAVLATGVALLFVGPGSAGILRGLHKASFVAWIGFTALHVLGHLPDLQATFLTKRAGRVEYNQLAAGRTGRTIALVGALVAAWSWRSCSSPTSELVALRGFPPRPVSNSALDPLVKDRSTRNANCTHAQM